MSHTKEPAALAILNPSGKAIRIWWSGAEVESARRIARDDFNTSPVYLYSEDVLLSLEKQRDDLLAVFSVVISEMEDRDRNDGNAPGHGHKIPGIWDSDNGSLSGKPCAWCAVWAKAKELIASVKGEPCTHSREIEQSTGDGTPVMFCPDCGRNEAQQARFSSDDTSAPAIVFYPAGSLGEPVESEGGEA